MIRFTAKLSTLILFLVYKLKSYINVLVKGINEKPCLFCGESCNDNEAICRYCLKDLPWNTFHCTRCALPFTKANHVVQPQTINIECGECIAVSPAFTKTVACFRYETPIDKAIHMLKYHHKQYFVSLLSYFLATKILQAYQSSPMPSCLIPVPMHRSKLKERGFNQAQLISNKLSRRLGIKSNSSMLHKTQPTPSQTGLSKVERIRNLKGVFQLTGPVSGLHVALIDDVVTTRATAETLCKLLIDAGAKRVDVWCIARTAKQRH